MKTVEEMTDAEIIEGVRSGSFALIPLTEPREAVVGAIHIDDWEVIEDRPALLIPLTEDQARFVAPQVI